MSAGWVAGAVRARALGRRRIGFAGARQVAASPSLPAALELLAASPYRRELPSGATLAQAQHAVAAAVLWQLRVLAGWLPDAGVRALRVLAGWFEIANVDGRLRVLAGEPAPPPYRIGPLSTAWPRLAVTGTRAELRAVLRASAWGDPGGESVADIRLGMRRCWAERIRSRVPAAAGWVSSRAALATGGEPDERWVAEVGWWRRLRTEGAVLLAGSGFGVDRPVGAAAVLAADAFLVRAALEVAARGGTALEDFDALA